MNRERLPKYHGLGNDFVVLDRRASGEDLSPERVRELCDRHRGIGADGVLSLLPTTLRGESGLAAMAKMVVHNADGSIAQMCGNGLRCAIKYLVDRGSEGAAKPARVAVETGAGVLESDLHYDADGVAEVTVDMGPARLSDPALPAGSTGGAFIDLPMPGFPDVRGIAVSMGNPHLVLLDRPLVDATVLGPRLEYAPGFPERTNVEFVQVGDARLDVVVWERGVGLTQACGTGACAAAAAAVLQGRLPAETFVPVRLPGGVLHIHVARDLRRVRMRGPVTFVFDAVVEA